MSHETNENQSKTLSVHHQEMLSQIRQIDVEQSRKDAGIQFKLSLFLLIVGIAISFFVEDWLLILVIAESMAFFFFLMSRAKHGFCELQSLIQSMDKQARTEIDSASPEQITPPQS